MSCMRQKSENTYWQVVKILVTGSQIEEMSRYIDTQVHASLTQWCLLQIFFNSMNNC
jgi:hypothetical protein